MRTSTIVERAAGEFATDIRNGLTKPGQKELPSKYLYDTLGSKLFEVIAELPEYGVTRADERQEIGSFKQAMKWLFDQARKGQTIQRYKGLGEMNADQLWETTMDAERRTLLRVDLKDIVESDEIFSTLMGEDVESRRKFIEENALEVRNLDV